MIFFPSWGREGKCRERAPVATMMCWASSVEVLPSAAFTSSFFPGSNLPSPMMTSMLFFFMRKVTPLLMPSATPRLRFTIPVKSTFGALTWMP